MTYNYTWANTEQSALLRDDGWFIPAEEGNRMYAEFLASGAVAADYVAPPAPPELTPHEKLKQAGLTVEDLAELIDTIQKGEAKSRTRK